MAIINDQQKAKPATDAYTGMLAVSLTALLIGCGVLYLDYARYPDKPPQKVDWNFRERPAPDQVQPKNAKAAEESPPDEQDKDKAKDPGDKKGLRP